MELQAQTVHGFPFFSCSHVRFGVKLYVLLLVFTPRRFQVPFPDEHCKNYVVENKIQDPDRDNAQPAGFGISLENTEEEQINEAAGKSKADSDIEHMRDHIGTACQNDLNDKEDRRCKKKGKFNRFRDAGEHGGESGGEQKPFGRFFLFRFCGAVHGQGCAGQTEYHENKFTGEVSGGVCTEMRHISGVSQLGKRYSVRPVPDFRRSP